MAKLFNKLKNFSLNNDASLRELYFNVAFGITIILPILLFQLIIKHFHEYSLFFYTALIITYFLLLTSLIIIVFSKINTTKVSVHIRVLLIFTITSMYIITTIGYPKGDFTFWHWAIVTLVLFSHTLIIRKNYISYKKKEDFIRMIRKSKKYLLPLISRITD